MALVGLGNSFVMWRIFLKQSKELNSLKNYLYTLLRNRGRSRLRSAFQERTVLRGTNMTLALCHIFSGRIITSIRFYRLGSWSKGGLYTTLVITTVCRLYLKNATETCNWLFMLSCVLYPVVPACFSVFVWPFSSRDYKCPWEGWPPCCEARFTNLTLQHHN